MAHSPPQFMGSFSESVAKPLAPNTSALPCDKIAAQFIAVFNQCAPAHRFYDPSFIVFFHRFHRFHHLITAMDWGALPKAALVSILSSLSTPELLQSALVSRSWAEAIAAVTHSSPALSVGLCKDSSSFEGFLSAHAGYLKQLQVYSFAGCSPLQRLPCPKLQALLLHNGLLQLGDALEATSLSSDLKALTDLTSLNLKQIMFVPGRSYDAEGYPVSDAEPLLSAITTMQKLQHISLQHVVEPNDPEDSPASWEGIKNIRDVYEWAGGDTVLPDGFLQHLPDLTSLIIDTYRGGLPAQCMQHLESVSKLQHLRLTWLPDATAAVFEGLPQLQQLTFLELGDVHGHLTASTCPGFSTLTALQQLILQWGFPSDTGHDAESWCFQPSLIAGMTKLQKLSLADAELSSPFEPPGGAHELLAALRGMQQLEILSLSCLYTPFLPPPQAYSALTASGSLQHLQLRGCTLWIDTTPWQHIFPAGQLMHQLQTLDVLSLGVSRLDSAALAAMVACCPHLLSLKLLGSEHSNVQLQPLLRLQSLTQLYVWRVDDTAAADVLVHLTNLRALRAACVDELSDHGLLQLTALQHLTELGLDWIWGYNSKAIGLGITQCLLSMQLQQALQASCPLEVGGDGSHCEPHHFYVVYNKAPPGSPPDVWQQVQAWYGAE